MDIVIGVWVPGLKGEHGGIRGSIELYHSLHGQGTVDEVRRFIIDIADVDNDPLIVGI